VTTRSDVDVVRAAVDCFNRRAMNAFLELIDPDVEWVPLNAVLEGDVYRGHAGIERFMGDVNKDIENMQLRLEDVFEVGENVVLHAAIVGRGRGSGMDLEFPVGWVIRVRDGRVDYLRAYPERTDALKAAEEAQAGVEKPLGPPARALDS
jgi:ketosteroid isomerase-like protein